MAPSGDGVYGAAPATVCAHTCCPSRRSRTGARRHLPEQDPEVSLDGFRARMLVAESGTYNAERPLEQCPRAGEVALRSQHAAQIVGIRRHIGVVRAVRRLAD